MRKHILIILAFTLPVLLILVITLVTYWPFNSITTQYDFVYANCVGDSYYYEGQGCSKYFKVRYVVVDGRLEEVANFQELDYNGDKVIDILDTYDVKFFIHDTGENESRAVTFEEVQALNLSDLATAPDGISISQSRNRSVGIFPFFDSYTNYGYFLKKGKREKEMHLINNNDPYYSRDNIQFMGWVL